MEDGRQRLVLRTVDAYFSIIRQQLFAEAAAHALDRAKRLRGASQARARVGLATELDVMRAELLAAQAEAALQAQEEALEGARDGLKLLLGRPLSSSIAVDVSAIPEAGPLPADDVAALTASALGHRLELREARDRIDDARRAESVARWSLLPDLQLDASYTRRGLGGGSVAFHDLLGGWRVGVRSSYGFDRTTLSASAARAALSAGAAARAATQMEEAVTAEVREAHRAVLRSHGAIAIHSKALEIAERQATLARLRYERGLADNVDLVAAEGNVLQARTAMIGAQVDHALARLALQRASGRLNPAEYQP
jgi:outer membrane protein TolC